MPRMKIAGTVFDHIGAMLGKLSGSGLTKQDAIDLGMEPMARAPEDLPLDLGGFLIPYHHPDGQPTGFYRFRYLQPPPPPKGFAAQAPQKPIRYAQPRGSAPRVYFPRLPKVPWPDLLRNPSQPLLLTEGELKAACATKLGVPTLGLGGVWSWRAGDKGLAVLPELEAIEWKGRTAAVVFDSDAASNDKVMAAENALARALSNLGAAVRIVRLPPAGEAKVGLDDYLVAHGPEALAKLVDQAQPWLSAEMLHKLNEEVVYLRDQGRLYCHNKTNQDGSPLILMPDAFVTHAFAPWRYVDLSGKTPKEKSAPAEWLKWRGRAEVDGLTFAPGQPAKVGARINTWEGWGAEPIEGDVTPWLELTRYLFENNAEALLWFEQWCAYPLQHPGAKMYSAVLLWGTQHGTGKTAIAYALGKIHGKGFIEVKNKALRGGFNGWLAKRTLVYGDEITASDARVDADYLKGLITQHTAHINEKFQVPYDLPDCANYIFTSNHPDALFLEDDDRRFFVQQIRVPPLPQFFYDKLDAWLHGPGPAALHHYLLNLPLSGFNPRARALETQSKADMVDICKSDLGAWVSEFKRNPEAVCKVSTGDYFKLWTTTELLALYDPDRRTRVTKNGLARELTRQGILRAANGRPCITRNGQHRLWIAGPSNGMENILQSQAGKLYDQERKGIKYGRKF